MSLVLVYLPWSPFSGQLPSLWLGGQHMYIDVLVYLFDSQGNEDDCKKVYVGGMPYSSTEDDMWSFFDHCGTITDIDCMKFPETGKFRGIAFISFKTEEAAKKALALDGSDMDGFYLKIQPYKATRTTKSSAFIPPVIEGYNRIYAGNLSWDITEEDLRKFLSDCNITSIRFGEDKETGEFKGYAHVDFSDSGSLTKALKLDQHVVCGRPVKISRAVPVRGAIRHPGSASAPSTMKPQQNIIGVMPPAVKPGENHSVVMPAAVKPEESYNEVVPPVVQPPENNTGVSSGKLKRRTCYECGERGHISSACPKKQATEQTAPNAS
ncbi:28 kDa ribonucleoprotein, chloroplastic-like [Chenopodium quinoa]|nr:28 kDa ribonucleoprotein, chloroplastic-like [Chenopodium quinoa]